MLMGIKILHLDEEGEPVSLAKTIGIGCMEILPVDVIPAIIDVDQNVELVFALCREEIILRFINESHVSASFVEGWVGSFDLVEPQISELGQHVVIGFLEGLVRIELLYLAPGVELVVLSVKDLLVDL